MGAVSGVFSKLCPHWIWTGTRCGEGWPEREEGREQWEAERAWVLHIYPISLTDRDEGMPHPLTRHQGAFGWRQKADYLSASPPLPPDQRVECLPSQVPEWLPVSPSLPGAVLCPCTSESFFALSPLHHPKSQNSKGELEAHVWARRCNSWVQEVQEPSRVEMCSSLSWSQVLALASNSFRISDTLSHFGEALISESVRWAGWVYRFLKLLPHQGI